MTERCVDAPPSEAGFVALFLGGGADERVLHCGLFPEVENVLEGAHPALPW